MSVPRWINHAWSWLRDPRIQPFVILAGFAVLATAIALLTACASMPTAGTFTAPKNDHPPAEAKMVPSDALSRAQHDLDVAREDVGRLEIRVQDETKAKRAAEREASVATLRAWCLWLSVVCLLGAAVCVALAIFLPAGAKLAWSGAAASFAVLIMLQTVSLALLYLMWVAIAGGVIIVGVIVWSLWKSRIVTSELGKFGCDAADALKDHAPDVWKRVRTTAEGRQMAAGVHATVAKIAEKLKP